MTHDETADYIRHPPTTLYVMNSEGTGPPRYKVGRRVLYRRSEVDEWIKARRVEPRHPELAAI
jgi:excisionase family DNA binding protein